jgi:hypothetical protein
MTLNFNQEFLPQPPAILHQIQNSTPKNLIKNDSKYIDRSIEYKMISIHIDRINITNCFESKRKSSHQITESDVICLEEIKKEKRIITYSDDGLMSEPSKRKLQKAIKYLNFITFPKKIQNKVTGKIFNMKLCFASLTLSSPQVHSDTVIKHQLINHLLVELKTKYKISNYVWKCEKQNNGNVHFHFIFDKFIPHSELRNIWNRLQNKLGYVDNYTKRMSSMSFAEYKATYSANTKKSEKDIRAAYAKGKSTGWVFPNSTDVHSLQFINDIDSYLIKYMSKSEQNKDIKGRLWGCSQSLSKIDGAREIVDSALSIELNTLVECGRARKVEGKYYQILLCNWFDFEYCNCTLLMSLLKEYLVTHFNIKDHGSS